MTNIKELSQGLKPGDYGVAEIEIRSTGEVYMHQDSVAAAILDDVEGKALFAMSGLVGRWYSADDVQELLLAHRKAIREAADEMTALVEQIRGLV